MTPHRAEVVSATEIQFADTFNLTVPFIDRHLADGDENKVVARWNDSTLTFFELADQVNRMASGLRRLGIKRDDRILILCRDDVSFLVTFFGALRIGAIAIPANYFQRTADYAYILQDSGARIVVATEEVLPELDPALSKAGDAVIALICAEGERDKWESLETFLAAGDSESDPEPTSPNSVAFWLYSSGSTGSPKAAVHQHKDPVWISHLFGGNTLKLAKKDLLFSPPKMFFAYGLGNSVCFPFWFGCEMVLMRERPTAENTLALMNKFRPTIYFGVPTLYAMQLAALESGKSCDFSRLRWCHSGGEALPPPLLEKWHRLTDCDIHDAIGSSEALHFYTANTPGKIKPGSAGRMIPGYDGRVIDENGSDVPDGEVGELMIRGKSVATTYWNKPEKTAESMVDGWFRTGDSVWRDDDGYIFFSGRANDMLKVGGIWVSPFEVESALMAHPAVLEAGVVGWPDNEGLIKPKAFVVLKEGKTPDVAMSRALTSFVRARLAPYKYPRWIEFLDELPKTASGKIQRFRLKNRSSVKYVNKGE